MKITRRFALRGLFAGVAGSLAGCISVGSSEGAALQASYQLHDGAAAMQRRGQPLVAALLIQPLPASALADTAAIAYSRRPHEFAFYQFASWAERPVRQLPRLLQQRLEAHGVAGAVGLLGEPLRADWLLTLAIDTLHHDVAAPPGLARLAVTAELFDRRNRTRVARRPFAAEVPAASADSAAAAAAMSLAVASVFDSLLPWLEDELQRAVARQP
ncbi:MAG: membrane integrity-associated transporter subunit PqiC [Burkholderiales bacterium]|nr:membrane integrity-associated transporter subunit PqiC [Burkholderiales bacterium]